MILLCWHTQSDQDFTQRLNIKPGVPQREESLCDQNKCLHAQYSHCYILLCWLVTWWERDTACDQVQVIHLKLWNCPNLCFPAICKSCLIHVVLSVCKFYCISVKNFEISIYLSAYAIFVFYCAAFRVDFGPHRVNNHVYMSI